MTLDDLKVVSENVDLDTYLYLYKFVRDHMEHPEWLGTFEKEEIEELLKKEGKIWLYYDGDIPVCSIFYLPITNQALQKHHVEYDQTITGALGPIMVREEYRGNGLQKQMQRVLEEYAKSIGKEHLFTKAHSDNIYSIKNILDDGFQLIDTYESERGINSVFIK